MRSGRRNDKPQANKVKTERQANHAGEQALSKIATTLATIIGSLAALATIVGFCLHLSGDVAYSTYLTALGVEPSSFPRAADWKIIHGYYVTLLQGLGLLTNVPWGTALTIIGLSTLAVVIIRIPVKEDSSLRQWIERQSFWVKEPLIAALASTVFLSAIVSIACCILLLAIVPGLAGEKFGKAKAKDASNLLKQKTEAFSELWRDDQRVVRGHVIAINEKLIAIYDVDLGVMRTLPLDNLELRTPLPGSKKPSRAQ